MEIKVFKNPMFSSIPKVLSLDAWTLYAHKALCQDSGRRREGKENHGNFM
jgi:hypothetical protein